MNSAQEIISGLGLQKHPEGGYFKELYRSAEIYQKDHLPERFNGDRSFCTSIYYLLEGNDFSAFHRILADEIWHFYTGSPILIYTLSRQNGLKQFLLGSDISAGQIPQFAIPKNTWFAAKCANISNFSLVGCTVSPGFDFADFTLADQNDLIKEFPLEEAIIKKMTR
ncbi:MAG: cupin domain-containing protein [Melioribacteraceae bacterium]|nr:cupin domain-containing protein [Melioribacteraceae bacterium]MCF8264315.1 cupin domain-containing protein [Melioribacteraceae bacterium]MCF8431426.1 cupin domain-containing protein [Melioribacteraceae bacterium]